MSLSNISARPTPDATWNDSLSWAALGSENSTHSSPKTQTSVIGLGIAASTQGTTVFSAVRNTTIGSSWLGNFASGDWALENDYTDPGPITLTFDTPIYGVGCQICGGDYAGFDVTIEAFDESSISLGSYTRSDGVTSGAHDNSAIFIGLLSTLRNIKSVVISLEQPGPLYNLAINHLSLAILDGPESATLTDGYTYETNTHQTAPIVRGGTGLRARGPLPSVVTTNPTVTRGNNNGELTYLWTQLSGPETPAIASPTALVTNITFSVFAPGTYVFQLAATSEAQDGVQISGYGRLAVTIVDNRVPAVTVEGS